MRFSVLFSTAAPHSFPCVLNGEADKSSISHKIYPRGGTPGVTLNVCEALLNYAKQAQLNLLRMAPKIWRHMDLNVYSGSFLVSVREMPDCIFQSSLVEQWWVQ